MGKILLAVLGIGKGTWGHVARLISEEEWDKILDEIILGFEAGKRAMDDEYVDELQPNWFEKNEKLTPETLSKCREMILVDQKLFHEKMKLFNTWFFALWD